MADRTGRAVVDDVWKLVRAYVPAAERQNLARVVLNRACREVDADFSETLLGQDAAMKKWTYVDGDERVIGTWERGDPP